VEVSVIVPFRNERRYLERCIDALAAQDYEGPHEVLLVDNGSTDGSAELARGRPVRLLTEPGRGSYRARNRGVAASTGRILAFTDGDCVPEPGWLRMLVAPFADPGVDLVLGGRAQARDTAGLRLLTAYDNARMAQILDSASPDHYYGATNNLAVRREVFDDNGRFEEIDRRADALLVKRIARLRGPAAVRFVPDARIRHLEIEGVLDVYRKKFTYGRSAQRTRARARVTALPLRDRFRLWRQTATPSERPALLALLAGGALCWSCGRVAGQASRLD
jgi:glycosyltransferase involved in cell wall biosynthesis